MLRLTLCTALLVLAAASLGCSSDTGWRHVASNTPPPGHPRLGPGRFVLSACVQSESGTPANPQVFLDAIDRIIERLELHEGEETDWLRGATAVSGCPTPASQFVTTVDVPSPHRLFVYLMETESGRAGYLESERERVCSGDTCAGVTTTLRIWNPNPDVVFEAVVDAFGLIGALLSPEDLEKLESLH